MSEKKAKKPAVKAAKAKAPAKKRATSAKPVTTAKTTAKAKSVSKTTAKAKPVSKSTTKAKPASKSNAKAKSSDKAKSTSSKAKQTSNKSGKAKAAIKVPEDKKTGKIITDKNKSLRMFKSDFLESLTHVHPATPFVFFVPVILFSIYGAIEWYNLPIDQFALLFVLGGAFWTISEYLIHRFVFHPPFSDTYMKWFYFYSHGVHHETPNDASRLVMPPLLSIPLSLLFYFLFRTVFLEGHLAIFSGFIVGYLTYDFLHYATHFHSFSWGWFKKLKKHHTAHHFTNPKLNYGVSNSFWDYIFFTKLKDNR